MSIDTNKDLNQLRHRWRSSSTFTEQRIDALIDEVERLRVEHVELLSARRELQKWRNPVVPENVVAAAKQYEDYKKNAIGGAATVVYISALKHALGHALGQNACPTAQPEPVEWTACLERLDTRPFGHYVRATWQELRQALGPGLPLPQVNLNVSDGDAYGSDADIENANVVTFSWSQNAVYAEIEIFEDGSREWFIRHRGTEDRAGSNGPETGLLDVRLLQMLFLITPKVLNLSPLYHIGSDVPIHAPALGGIGNIESTGNEHGRQ